MYYFKFKFKRYYILCFQKLLNNLSSFFLYIYNQIKMKNKKDDQNSNLVCFFKDDLYFQQFIDLLPPCHKFESQEQQIELFVSYCIPRKIQNVVLNLKLPTNFKKDDVFNQILTQIFSDQKMKEYMNYYGNSEKKSSTKSQKDRKTSFYRTILKHLRQINDKTSKCKSSSFKFISDVQAKLSKNTIANEDIQQLYNKFNQEIVDYLESPNSLNDFIFKNKSKANKSYYVLHLNCLAIQAKNGRLSQYPFFSKPTLHKQIQRMVKIMYQEFLCSQQIIENKQLKQNKLPFSTQIKQCSNNTDLFLNCSQLSKKLQQSKQTSQILLADSLSEKSFEIINEDYMKRQQNSLNYLFCMEMDYKDPQQISCYYDFI